MTIDLQAHPLGTLFTYTPSTDWCHDGKAQLRECGTGERFLVDTYWGTNDSSLLPTELETATPSFDPTAHREIREWDVDVYDFLHDGIVVTITRQHGCYRSWFIPKDTPEPTLKDRTRHALAQREQELRAALVAAESAAASVENTRRQLERLEAEEA